MSGIEDLNDVDTIVVVRADEALAMLAMLATNEQYDEWADFLDMVWPEEIEKWLEILPTWRQGGIQIGCHTYVEPLPDCFTAWADQYMHAPITELPFKFSRS